MWASFMRAIQPNAPHHAPRCAVALKPPWRPTPPEPRTPSPGERSARVAGIPLVVGAHRTEENGVWGSMEHKTRLRD